MSANAKTPLSILMVASEAVPFAKTGGLADVTTALSKALNQLGHDVTLVMPKYRDVDVEGDVQSRLSVTLGTVSHQVGFVHHELEGTTGRAGAVRVVFVECDALYDRDGLYETAGGDHPDNALRFAVLARAALAFAATQRKPDIVHAHDWQTGLVPFYVRHGIPDTPTLPRVPTVFTVHNLAYQGIFPSPTLSQLDLGTEAFDVEGFEFYGQMSFLKAGINFSDRVTTVSEAYAREILTPEFGFGFDGVVSARRARLRGILNGIDTDVWNPASDPFLPRSYSANDLGGKRALKQQLLREFELSASRADLGRPVVGMISRLVYQKGFDLIAEIMDELPALGARFVVLGTGERQYEEMWQAAARRHPDLVSVRIGYDERLAHLIEAGADMFLMPSRYEPCGLNQMYSMRYGTVPVVRATGGLDDAVDQYDDATGEGTGFKFDEFKSVAMLGALRRAIAIFRDPVRWESIQRQGMARDFSWTASASAYVREYRTLVDEAADDR